MIKVKIYRGIGWFFVVAGIVAYIANIYQHRNFQQFMANPSAEFIPAIFGLLTSFAFNIFLWAGLLALWKADKIKNSDKKSKWLKIIKPYAIFTVIMFVILLIAILFPRRQ